VAAFRSCMFICGCFSPDVLVVIFLLGFFYRGKTGQCYTLDMVFRCCLCSLTDH
jgi:hypothetical protein